MCIRDSFEGLLGHVVVAAHHGEGLTRAEDDLPDLARRYLLVVVIDESDIVEVQGPAARSRPAVVESHVDGDADLGHPKTLHTGDAKTSLDLAHHPRRAAGPQGNTGGVIGVCLLYTSD